MNHPWILTATGRKFHYGLHDPNEFYLPDIARSLSRICRFNGHLSDQYEDDIYSVAQHSVYVLRYLMIKKAPVYTYQWAVAHDAIESYWVDVVSPLKGLLPQYKLYEGKSETCFIRHYDIPYDDAVRAYVKGADYQLLLSEATALTEIPTALWDHPDVPDMTLHEIDPDFYPWRPKKARDELIAAFDQVGLMEKI